MSLCWNLSGPTQRNDATNWVWVMHPVSQSVFTQAYKVFTLQYVLRSACESQFPSYKWFKILIEEIKRQLCQGQKIYAIVWIGRMLWVVFLFLFLYFIHSSSYNLHSSLTEISGKKKKNWTNLGQVFPNSIVKNNFSTPHTTSIHAHGTEQTEAQILLNQRLLN